MKKNILLLLVVLMVAGLISYKISYALFSDVGTSTGNILSAATSFPTSPTPTLTITSIPTPTITPTPTIIPTNCSQYCTQKNMTEALSGCVKNNICKGTGWVADNVVFCTLSPNNFCCCKP